MGRTVANESLMQKLPYKGTNKGIGNSDFADQIGAQTYSSGESIKAENQREASWFFWLTVFTTLNQ